MKKLKEERKKIRQRVHLRQQGIGGTQRTGPCRGRVAEAEDFGRDCKMSHIYFID